MNASLQARINRWAKVKARIEEMTSLLRDAYREKVMEIYEKCRQKIDQSVVFSAEYDGNKLAVTVNGDKVQVLYYDKQTFVTYISSESFNKNIHWEGKLDHWEIVEEYLDGFLMECEQQYEKAFAEALGK
jgi:rRNA maturation protein Rpf1